MVFKPRIEKDELKIWRSLNARMQLTADETNYYLHQEKGFKGELMFDSLTEKLPARQLVLNDLLLEANNTKFQIDTTVIVPEKIHLFEVKNFVGNYYYEDNKLFTFAGREISNPLEQSSRAEFLFRQLLLEYGIRIPIESHIVFINPEFTLYQAPKNKPFIFASQLPSFMKKFSSTASRLNDGHTKLAGQLVSLHQVDSPYDRIRPYTFEQVDKGVLCGICLSKMDRLPGDDLVCSHCGAHEKVDDAIVRSAQELKLLFPDMKMTTNVVHDWCQVVDSRKTVLRVLKGNFTLIGAKKGSHFV